MPWFCKECPDCIHLWVKFFIQNVVLTGSVLQFLQSVFEKCYNLIKSFQFSRKIMWNFRAFCHVYNNDNASKCQEFKADARYFYGNQITQVSNKICACESTVLLKPLKPRSWLPAFYAKPQSWLLAVNSILEKKPPKFSIGAFFSGVCNKMFIQVP